MMGEPPDSERAYLQKIRDSLQVISDLEVEQLRLAHFFSLTNTMLNDPAAMQQLGEPPAAASERLKPEAPAEAASALTESDFEQAFLHSLAPLAVADSRGAFVDCNNRFSQLAGLSRTQLQTKTVFSLVRPIHLDDAVAAFKHVLSRETDPGTAYILDAHAAAPDEHGARRPLTLAISLVPASKDHAPDVLTHICIRIRTADSAPPFLDRQPTQRAEPPYPRA